MSAEEEAVKRLLWTLHEASQEASNEPTRENIRAVQDLTKRLQRALPAFWWARAGVR